MDGQVNLSHLSEEECKQILSVIERDFNLRQQEQDRLKELEAEIKQAKVRSDILSKGQGFNENCCIRCLSQFYMFFNPKVLCIVCNLNVCKKCSVYNSKQKDYTCSLCKKQEELEALSNKWFYSNIAERFDRFGSADVVRLIHKRKTDTDFDSDSGTQPPINSNHDQSNQLQTPSSRSSVENDPRLTADDDDERDVIMSHFRERLDAIERSVQNFNQQENLKGSELQKQFFENSAKQNMASVETLLTSVAKQLASNLNPADNDNSSHRSGNLEQQEAICKKLLHDAVYQLYSTSTVGSKDDQDPFAFIDPASMSFNDYTKRLAEAIFNKINEDLHQSRREIEVKPLDNENYKNSASALSRIPQFSDSEVEDLRVTTDSMSDVDVRERVNLWQKSIESNPSRSESLSRMSLSHSQNEADEPTFIESQVLTEKLAALSQTEKPQYLSQSSVESECEVMVIPATTTTEVVADDILQLRSKDSDYNDRSSENSLHSASQMRNPEIFLSNVEESLAGSKQMEIVEDSNLGDSIKSSRSIVTQDPASRPLTPDLKFDSEQYEVTADSIFAFATRKKEMLVLPSFDDDDSLSKTSDLDLEVTSGHGSDHSYGPWKLAINNRIANNSFRASSRQSYTDDPPKIFLPKNVNNEAPVIGEKNSAELSDTDSLSVAGDDDDNDIEFDEDKRAQQWHTDLVKLLKSDTKVKQARDSFVQTDDIERQRSETKDVDDKITHRNEQRNTCVQTTGTETDGLNERGDLGSDGSFDVPDFGDDPKPKFVETPQDVVISAGQSLRSRACFTGKKPIDVFWYHDTCRLDFDDRCTIAHKGRNFSLEMLDAKISDEGNYVCIGVNEHGQCSHTFSVTIIDPEAYQKPWKRSFNASDHKVTSSRWSNKTSTTTSTYTTEHHDRSTVDKLSQSCDIVSSGVMSSDASTPDVTSASTLDALIIESDVLEQKPESSLSVIKPAKQHSLSSESEVEINIESILPKTDSILVESKTEPAVVFDAANDVSLVQKITSQNFGKRSLGSCGSGSEELASVTSKREEQFHALPAQSVSTESLVSHLYDSSFANSTVPIEHEVENGSQNIELQLSFTDFEKLYESHAFTPNQLKSGKFTPEQAKRIREILNKPDEHTETRKLEDEVNREKQIHDLLHYKEPGVKSRLYGRDYVIVDSESKSDGRKWSRRSNQNSKNSVSSRVNSTSDDDGGSRVSTPVFYSPTTTQEPQQSSFSRLHDSDVSSPSRRHHSPVQRLPEHLIDRPDKTSTSRRHTDTIIMTNRHSQEPYAKGSHQHVEITPPDDGHHTGSFNFEDDKFTEFDNVSETRTAEDELDELSLPSVKSLRLRFNAPPLSPEDSTFTRNYSLTARDLPNSVFAQQRRQTKERGLHQPLLHLVPETSSDSRRKHSDSFSSRDD